MNTRDRAITALTPGSAFNANGLIWRSVSSLAQFAGISPEETLEMLAGDLAELVTVRPSKAGSGLLVALKEHVPQAADPGNDEQVAVAGGPAFNAPAEEVEEIAEALFPPGMDPDAPATD